MEKESKKRHLTVIAVVTVLLFISAYTISYGGAGEKLLAFWQSWTGEEQIVDGPEPPNDVDPVPEPDPEPKPEPQPEPEPEPQPEPQPELEPEPEPEPKPSEPDPGGNTPNTPIIYVGQQLIIPVSGAVTSDRSQVIKEGVLPGTQKQIALTFDSGWLYDQTTALLDVLDAYSVKSTFFPRALWVKSNPELAREIVKRGHIMENHSLTHGHMTQMTDAQIRNEMRESTRIVREIAGANPYLFRPPYGEYDNRMLKILAEEGYPYTVMWTVDTHDWAEEIRGVKVTTDYLVKRVLDNASDNGIILMHVGGYNTVDALPRIITGLRDQGYRLVTVNEMVPKQNVVLHTVIQGDTLYSLGQRYGVTVNQIILANGL